MKYDCIVIGSGPAGLTAGLYVCRAGYKVAIVTGYTGSMSSIARIDNYPGVMNASGQDILDTMMMQCKVDCAYVLEYEATQIEFKDDTYYVTLDDDTVIEATGVIDATGGRHKTLGIESEEKWLNNGISFCATCDGPMCEGKDVVVVGGGNSAMSSAIELAKYCNKVHIVYRKNEFTRVEKPLLDKAKTLDNIICHMSSNVKEIVGDDELKGIITDKDEKIDAYMVFYFIGFDANEVHINGTPNGLYMKAGDNSAKYRQAIIAAGQGAEKALDMIEMLKSLSDK